MKSAVETLNPTRVRLSVEVPFEDLKPSLDAAYKKISKQVSIPGFRKGKVPAPIIDQRIGRDAVLGEAVNDTLPDLYVEALEQNDLTPLGQPELNLDTLEDGKPLEFSAELDVKPDIELPEYHGIEVEVDDIDVGDDEVDEQLETLRERFGTLTPVDRAAAEGDFVTIDLSAAKDGEPIEEAQATGMSYRVGRDSLLEGLDEALTGMSVDEEKTFPTTLAGGDYKGQSVDVTVRLSAVKEQELPSLDDDFAQQASEFDTMEELREDTAERVLRQARMQQAGAARDAVLEKLLGMVEVPLPDNAVAEEIKARRDQINAQLSYSGMTEADYLEAQGQSEDEFAADLDKQVREGMATQFLLGDIAAKESLGVEENELSQYLVQRAQQSGVSPEQYIQYAMQQNQVPEMVAEVRRSKALQHILESAVVTDTSGNHVELKRLQGDGTYAEETTEDEGEGEGETTAEEPGASTSDAASSLAVAGEYITPAEDDSTDDSA